MLRKRENIELYSVTVLDYGIGFGDLSIDSRYSRFESISLDGSVGLAGVDALEKNRDSRSSRSTGLETLWTQPPTSLGLTIGLWPW